MKFTPYMYALLEIIIPDFFFFVCFFLMMHRSKMAAKYRFLFHTISILAKIWKTTFPKEFFNEIWLKVGEHE